MLFVSDSFIGEINKIEKDIWRISVNALQNIPLSMNEKTTYRIISSFCDSD